eukprot:TRINITY_DN12518_c2_g1_i1.p2 TRINITY_DN12518_c2_g1~~TRINITY_DN12518_c2_g1_i1.p2  ORF type:complete len:425 (+),score=129.63 TRINITY_DN12518_c2_g1_i1:66-1277(+)
MAVQSPSGPLSAAELGTPVASPGPPLPPPSMPPAPAPPPAPAGGPRLEPGMRIGPDGRLQIDPVCTFLGTDQAPSKTRLRPDTLPRAVESAERLAREGQWADAAAVAAECAAAAPAAADRIRALHAQAVALVKLGRRPQAAEVLARLPPEAPFSLRLLRAELLAAQPQQQPPGGAAHNLKQSEIALNALLRECEGALADPAQAAAAELWRRRKREVLLRSVHCHSDQSNTSCALKCMEDLSDCFPTDLTLLVQFACLGMKAGQVAVAHRVLGRIGQLDETPQQRAAVSLVGGFLEICDGDFNGASKSFDDILKEDPRNISAKTNRAICEVYMQRLPRAIRMLEDAVRADPPRALAPALVHNLSTAYELEVDNAQAAAKKRVVLETVERYKGDDFPRERCKAQR